MSMFLPELSFVEGPFCGGLLFYGRNWRDRLQTTRTTKYLHLDLNRKRAQQEVDAASNRQTFSSCLLLTVKSTMATASTFPRFSGLGELFNHSPPIVIHC